MSQPWVVANATLLLLCASMYLGTGWSLVLFQFPVARELRPDNYYTHFVPQVEAATRFFTYMTMVMIVSASLLIWSEWGSAYVWLPVTVLVGVVAATLLTTRFILPYNRRMKAGIDDADELRHILARWTALNRVRVGIWSIQWLAIAGWFVGRTS